MYAHTEDDYMSVFFQDYRGANTMSRREMRIRPSEFVLSQSVWYGGMDQAMKMLGAAPQMEAMDLVNAQNQAIRECWRMTGSFIRDAMRELSSTSGIKPE